MRATNMVQSTRQPPAGSVDANTAARPATAAAPAAGEHAEADAAHDEADAGSEEVDATETEDEAGRRLCFHVSSRPTGQRAG